MRNLKYFIYNILFSSLFFSSFAIFGQTYSIKGNIENDLEIIELELFKYISIYESRFVDIIPVLNGTFYFEYEVEEPDVYLLKYRMEEQFLLFIWDGNILLDINEDWLWKSKVSNSELTEELKDVQKSISLIGAKYRSIDSLLTDQVYISIISQAEKDTLVSKRAYEFDKSIKAIADFKENFIQENPNSFISLYFLTLTGFENTDKKRVELFSNLSESLKKHSRAKIYLEK